MDLGKEELILSGKLQQELGGFGGERGRGLETTHQKLPGPWE